MLKINDMKKVLAFFIAALMIQVFAVSCKNQVNESAGPEAEDKNVVDPDLVIIGKDIITDIIVKPDTLGDPWEVEKVKGYDGVAMIKTLFDRIYDEKLTVYDCVEEKVLQPDEIRNLEKQFQSDFKMVGKIQFLEDWYFDPESSRIVKKIKSFAFGYEKYRGSGIPSGYVPLFRVKTE
jgi:hypothetical protein